MIPAMESIIKYGGQYGVKEIVYGMAHRGRLNMLANVLAKPYQVIFHEFSGGSANPDDVGGSGDVKYHLGTSTDREFDGVSVHMSLVPNPSHLEAVRSEEHTSELQSLMRISYAVFCLKKKIKYQST